MTTLGDYNVPVAPHGFYELIHLEPTWQIQRMAASTDFDGALPGINPVISAGEGLWDGMAAHGGMFDFQSIGKPIVIEATYSKNATFTVVLKGQASDRTPSSCPFTLMPGEKIQVTSTGATSSKAEIGFLVRLAGDRIV